MVPQRPAGALKFCDAGLVFDPLSQGTLCWSRERDN